ncbi:hypothetical protein ABXV03_15685 [Streptomyces harbinensis]
MKRGGGAARPAAPGRHDGRDGTRPARAPCAERPAPAGGGRMRTGGR